MNIVFVGAGRLATNLALALHGKSFNIIQVYSRTIESAAFLAGKVDAIAITNLSEISPNADLYIFSVKDSVLTDLLNNIPPNKGLWVHTAGSLPLEIFDKYNPRFGVLYPFQTFNKDRLVDFREIPLFIETNIKEDLSILQDICCKISNQVYSLSSDKRQYLHLTGVFACNFVNQMYAISENILKKEGIPFDVVLPLIDETAAKVHQISPKDAQTGPAVRYDTNVIDKHLTLLEDKRLKNIYKSISEYIHETNKKNQ